MTIDEIYGLASNLNPSSLDLFVRMVAYNDFNEKEIEVLYRLIEKNEDPRFLMAPRFKNLPDSHLGFMIEIIKTSHDVYNIKNLFSYSPSMRDKIISYYELGYDLIPLIDIENSNWYLEFLMECLYNNVDVTKLSYKGLSYDQIYNLAVCMALSLNVSELVDNPSITKRGIIDYYVGDKESNRIFIVEGLTDEASDELESCVVKAPNPRLANLIACLNSELNPFRIFNKEINLEGYGLIYSSMN